MSLNSLRFQNLLKDTTTLTPRARNLATILVLVPCMSTLFPELPHLYRWQERSHLFFWYAILDEGKGWKMKAEWDWVKQWIPQSLCWSCTTGQETLVSLHLKLPSPVQGTILNQVPATRHRTKHQWWLWKVLILLHWKGAKSWIGLGPKVSKRLPQVQSWRLESRRVLVQRHWSLWAKACLSRRQLFSRIVQDGGMKASGNYRLLHTVLSSMWNARCLSFGFTLSDTKGR